MNVNHEIFVPNNVPENQTCWITKTLFKGKKCSAGSYAEITNIVLNMVTKAANQQVINSRDQTRAIKVVSSISKNMWSLEREGKLVKMSGERPCFTFLAFTVSNAQYFHQFLSYF